MKENQFTIDQKLKAIEIAVAMTGPLKSPDRTDTTAEEMAMDFIQYQNTAGLILRMALEMKLSLPEK